MMLKDPKHPMTPGTSLTICPDVSVDVITHISIYLIHTLMANYWTVATAALGLSDRSEAAVPRHQPLNTTGRRLVQERNNRDGRGRIENYKKSPSMGQVPQELIRGSNCDVTRGLTDWWSSGTLCWKRLGLVGLEDLQKHCYLRRVTLTISHVSVVDGDGGRMWSGSELETWKSGQVTQWWYE